MILIPLVMRPAKGESIRDNDLRAILVDNLPPGCQLVVSLKAKIIP